jgi:hypothetical protein
MKHRIYQNFEADFYSVQNVVRWTFRDRAFFKICITRMREMSAIPIFANPYGTFKHNIQESINKPAALWSPQISLT